MRRPVCTSLLVLLTAIGSLVAWTASTQHADESVNWKAQLAKAKRHLTMEPSSAFWHNQAAIAYDALGDFSRAEKELKLASNLNPGNPVDDYALYALYKRKGYLRRQRRTLLKALEKDSANPVGHFELGLVLEKEREWEGSLIEYGRAKALAAKVKEGQEYLDPHGMPYSVDGIRASVDNAIDRATKFKMSEENSRYRRDDRQQ